TCAEPRSRATGRPRPRSRTPERIHPVVKFGLFFQAPEAPGQSHAERYREMIDLIGLADTLGFDVAWLAELHFGGAFSLLSNPLMAVPGVAQRTRRIPHGPPGHP